MSCYLVNVEDIQALTQWAEQRNLLPEGLDRATTARAIGRVNIESVAYRYRDIPHGKVAQYFLNMSDRTYLRRVAEPFTGDAIPDNRAAQLCGTVEYQSCERTDWEQSPVKRWLEEWRAQAERVGLERFK